MEKVNLLPKKNGNIQPVSFRNLVPEIEKSDYLTHSVFYYPAKFIPHVVRYCINEFTEEGDLVLDPFSGCGTVGLEAYLCKRDSFLLDLNPILNHIMPLKIPQIKKESSKTTLYKMLNKVVKSKKRFYPKWSNLEYWYPEDILDIVSKYWGGVKGLKNSIYSKIIESSLIKVSKHFSYAEHRTPKLFRSKKKISYIKILLKSVWREKLDDMLFELSLNTVSDINQFISLTQGYKNKVYFKGGIDSCSFNFEDYPEFDLVITSPPYLQAQEYIRTSKMDLFWLDYDEEYIKELSKLEIPYRKADRIIETNTLNKVRKELKRKDLLPLLDSYFCYVIKALENSMNRLKRNSKACIFIGNPKIDGIDVEIWKILKEYFVERGFTFNAIYEDQIKVRQLFSFRKNKNPEGMKSEYLLVLSRR